MSESNSFHDDENMGKVHNEVTMVETTQPALLASSFSREKKEKAMIIVLIFVIAALVIAGGSFAYFHLPRPTYTVTFETNGGSNPPDAQIVKEGETAITPQMIPSLDGYTFTGWYLHPGDPYDFDTIVQADLTLYAGWQQQEGTIIETFFVTAEEQSGIYVRSEPDRSGKKVEYIKKGDVSRLLKYLNETMYNEADGHDWYHVLVVDTDETGWIRSDMVTGKMD